uniref:Uncharacterized protein n=1 Tax=Romanomermis culicivorax TaxID=13658 RepID=A0A915IEU4_ROMCU
MGAFPIHVDDKTTKILRKEGKGTRDIKHHYNWVPHKQSTLLSDHCQQQKLGRNELNDSNLLQTLCSKIGKIREICHEQDVFEQGFNSKHLWRHDISMHQFSTAIKEEKYNNNHCLYSPEYYVKGRKSQSILGAMGRMGSCSYFIMGELRANELTRTMED